MSDTTIKVGDRVRTGAVTRTVLATHLPWLWLQNDPDLGGKGGPAGRFAGTYHDSHGDRPQLEAPKFWMPMPAPPAIDAAR